MYILIFYFMLQFFTLSQILQIHTFYRLVSINSKKGRLLLCLKAFLYDCKLFQIFLKLILVDRPLYNHQVVVKGLFFSVYLDWSENSVLYELHEFIFFVKNLGKFAFRISHLDFYSYKENIFSSVSIVSISKSNFPTIT